MIDSTRNPSKNNDNIFFIPDEIFPKQKRMKVYR